MRSLPDHPETGPPVRKTALVSTCLALGLLPIVFYFSWPRPLLIALVAAMAVPLSLALAAFAWPAQALLRWAAVVTNVCIALLMGFLFAYMLLHVGRAPPNAAEALPVVAAAFVMLFVPILNVVALGSPTRAPR
jgi:hypothetical protein